MPCYKADTFIIKTGVLMNQITPLIEDEFTGLPLKRSLNHLLKMRNNGIRGVGVYCTYAPVEIIRAGGAVPITLCAYANKTIPEAEKVLPSNLCPLIKSSYGFIVSDTCPFFELSEVVVGETTCDGKKKMFELISSIKPLHVMDLPQIPDSEEALTTWAAMISKLKRFMEKNLDVTISNEKIEEEIKNTNNKNKLMNRFFEYASIKPSVLSWNEMYDIIALAQIETFDGLDAYMQPVFEKLDERVKNGISIGSVKSPRVLVTGCPVNGDSAKVLKTIEEAGGVIVALEGCSGMKPYMMSIDENTPDPIMALSKAYLTIPCSCMTPNEKRLQTIDTLIDVYKPDAVIDIILQACHSYNIESYKIEQHIKSKHNLQFLKVETDYSTGDVERIRMRVEALLENIVR
jgi:benzoyl-CoA reductase/2-hydroxyglutaryl-CoA dehydratase subunit BcrC/BadD/HgdB